MRPKEEQRKERALDHKLEKIKIKKGWAVEGFNKIRISFKAMSLEIALRSFLKQRLEITGKEQYVFPASLWS